MEKYILHRIDTLVHYGVDGQKWGVRRYQNEDGSYKSGAEGRYAQPVKGTISGSKQNAPSRSGMGQLASIKISSSKRNTMGYERAEKNGPKYSVTTKSGGGGGSAAETTEDEKKIDRKNIHIYDVSEKLPEKGSKKSGTGKGSGGGSGKSSSKKETSEKSSSKKAASDEKSEVKQEQVQEQKEEKKIIESKPEEKSEDKVYISSFKPNKFYSRIQKLDHLDSLSKAEIKEIDELVKQYRIYKAIGSPSSKKTKAIDEFIKKYELWKSNRKKNVSARVRSGEKKVPKDQKDKNMKQSAMNEEYELYHHGILGMKWGVRRYQNEDGTLTAAGKKRYRTDDDLNDKGETRKSVIDRLNKNAARNDKMSETYYNKSEYKKQKDDFDNSVFTKSLWSTSYDKDRGFTYDENRGWQEKHKWDEKTGRYSREKDKNLNRSESYENKAISQYSDARRLGKNYQRNKAITSALIGGMAGAGIGMFMGPNRHKGVEANVRDSIVGAIAGASIGAISGKSYGKKQQGRTEKKYGFK